MSKIGIAIAMMGLLFVACEEVSPEAMPAASPGIDTLSITRENMYQFPYPKIQLRRRDSANYVFLLAGPAGNWRAVGGTGVTALSRKSGSFPFTLQVGRDLTQDSFAVQLEFIGSEFIGPDGITNERGRVYPFQYSE